MDIVLNVDSARKTAAFISLRDNERGYGSQAMVVATKFPQFAFGYLFELLGVKAESEEVTKYLTRFPEHKILPHPTRGTITFEVTIKDEVTVYTIEELIAQLIEYGVMCAADTAQQEISGVVFTVPPYFTQAQRKALLFSAELANAKVLQLLNSPTAIAINYGVFRSKEWNATAKNIMFYDMGAQSTVAAIVQYVVVVFCLTSAVFARGVVEVHACCLLQHASTSDIPLGWLVASISC
jgi:hypoxia up-regulated 1